MRIPDLRLSALRETIGEFLLLTPVLASFIWTAVVFSRTGYLPQPFVADVNDTFMDWFNTAYYANRSGAYDVWHSVYPPLSFVFLRLFSIHRCYIDPFTARDCDWVGTITLLVSYIANCTLAAVAFRRRDRATALPRTLAFAFGLPLLFALERGNILLICLIPFILVYGRLLGSRTARAAAVAITINFKPYLLVPWLALAIRRDWRSLELAGVATLALYLLTLMCFGSGSVSQLVENTRLFASVVRGQFFTQSYLSTSYSTLLMVRESALPILAYLPSQLLETVLRVIPLVIVATQFAALAGLTAAWLQPRHVPLSRNVALLIGGYLCTQSPGGYTLIFLVFPVLLETGRRPTQVIALVAAYILSVSFEHIIATVINATAVSWLSGRSVHVSFGIAIGQFVRPGLVILIVWALALDSIIVSIRAHRHNAPSLGLRRVEQSRHA